MTHGFCRALIGLVVVLFGLFGCSFERTTEEHVGFQAAALCSTATLSTSVPSPVATGTQVTLTASASCGGAGAEYKFAYQWPSNPSNVTTIRDFASASTAVWNTSGVPSGTYHVLVFVRTAGNANTETISTVANYMVGGVCDVATLAASPPTAPATSPPPLGTTINLSATSTCRAGVSAEYQFFYIPPGTANYVQIGAAGSWGGPTATLDTSSLGAGASGTYSFNVRSRGVGNLSSNYEGLTYAGNYALGKVCLNATLATNPVSPQLAGTSVGLGATSTCYNGATAQYHFTYKLSSESTYHDVQTGYGGPSATWNTTGLLGGTYQVQVYSRGVGNASIQEGYTIKNYDLTPSITLVNNGVPLNIVLGTNPSQFAQDAAAELQSALLTITGVAFPIVPNATATTPGILVGSYQTDFPSLPLATQLPTDANPTYKEGFVVQIAPPDRLLLIGKTDIAVSHAVTRFLEKLGARWFFQGANWTVMPSAVGGNFTYTADAIVDRPFLAYRVLTGLAFSDPQSHADNLQVGADQQNWRRHNKLAYGIKSNNSLNLPSSQTSWTEPTVGLIPYTNANDADPNWFASVNPTPTCGSTPTNRYGYFAANNPHTTIETSNPLVRDKHWAWQLNQVIPTAFPDSDGTSVEPGDGTGAISQAPCTGTGSDQMSLLANDTVARLAASSDPKLNQRYVTFLGGYYHQLPPSLATTTLTRKVNVAVMPYDAAAFGGYLTTQSLLDGWWNKGASVGIFHNLSYPPDLSNIGSYYSQSMDGSSSDYASDSVALASDFVMYAQSHVSNVALETTDNFGLHGLAYYLIAKLMWNPNADVTALRQDFFDTAFGPATNDLKGYFDLLDPKGQPKQFTKELMSQLAGFLESASTHAAGNTKVLTRINELKSYLHHNALWWQIYRAPHNSAQQICLVKALLQHDYFTRFSYLNAQYADFNLIVPGALAQFGPDTDWNNNDANVSWRQATLRSCDPNLGNVANAFAADKAYFASTLPSQVAFPGDPVGVTFAGPPQNNGWIDGTRPMKVGLYTAASSTSVTLNMNVGSSTNPAGPAVPTQVTLTNPQGAVVATQTVQPTAAYQQVTFGGLLNHTGYVATVNGYGSLVWFANNGTAPLAQQLDKIHRGGISSPATGLYFYVPLGTSTVEYTWNRHQLIFGNDKIALAVVPHRLWICDNPATCGTTGPTATAVPYNGGTDIADYNQKISVPVPAGAAGKLWYFTGLLASELWFYNVPPYVSTSPNTMVIPRQLAQHDGFIP